MHAAGAARGYGKTLQQVPVIVLLIITILVFSPSLGASFHLDDVTLFSDPIVTSPSGWWYVWRPLQTRPLTYFTFWLNYQIGGQNAFGYHAVNIVLHVAATWLLYRMLMRVAGTKPAYIGAVLFALHPIQAEPINYVFERATLLATLFCLLSAHSWLDGTYQRSIGFFVFALLCKEECVAFPVFLLLIRPAVKPAIAMLALSAAAGIRVLLALEFLHISGAGSRAGISPLDYLLTQGTVILRYLVLLFAPHGFTCDPDIPVVRHWRAWMAWTAVIALAALIWRFRPAGKWFAAGLILLAPSSSIFPAEDLAADRRLYLPMIAFAGFAGLVLERVSRPPILIPAAVALAALSMHRSLVWRSEQRLWAEAAQHAPRKVRPRIVLARLAGTEDALRILDEAHTLAPNDPRPLIEKGLRLMNVKLTGMAAHEFECALALAPNDPATLNNYGTALSLLGKREAAIEQFRHALRVQPCAATPRKKLGLLGVKDETRCE
jgi:hypothetical protein